MLYDILRDMPYFLSGLFVVNIFIAFTIIFLERKNPSATLAWIMILFIIPVGGIFLYVVLSQNLSRQKIFKVSRGEEETISQALTQQINDMKLGNFVFSNPGARQWQELIRLNQTYGQAYYTQDNKIKIMTDGRHMFHCLLQDIGRAMHTINVQYFIIKNDEVGKELIDALTAKAKEGVEVRLLIDSLGGRQFNYKSAAVNRLIKAGGKVAFFFPPKFKYLNLKLNYRNHRKLVVIDGEIGYIGGFNVGREYLGKKKKFGYWRDTHLKLLGSSVQDINARFLLDWRFASKENLVISEAFYSDVIQEGQTGVQIVSSGPDEEKMQIKRAYMRMITMAKKNIYIQTPYFVPDSSILESLKMAVQSGVDVRLMIPRMPDHVFVYWATYAYAGELVKAGAKVYIYNKGFLHAKTMVVDGQVASVGSANFDVRSFKLNFEANAIIFDPEEAYKLEAIYETDMANSYQLTRALYRDRGTLIKFKESIARLLTDIL